jgi:hypothetical protein
MNSKPDQRLEAVHCTPCGTTQAATSTRRKTEGQPDASGASMLVQRLKSLYKNNQELMAQSVLLLYGSRA